MRRTIVITACLAMALAGSAWAEPLENAAVDAVPQRYVMTLPRTPVGEVAEEVLGQTLGLPVTVDPRVDARMTFRVDGVYSPRALARELGYQLWNVDVALIEDPSRGLVLIPAAALPEAIAGGAEVVSPLALTPGETPATTGGNPEPRKPIVYGDRRGVEAGWPILLALMIGWIAGLVTPRLARSVASWRRRRSDAALVQAEPAGEAGPSDVIEVDFRSRNG